MTISLETITRAIRDAHDEALARAFEERATDEERRAKRAVGSDKDRYLGKAAAWIEAAQSCRANVRLRADMAEWHTRTSGTRPIAIPDDEAQS